MKINKWLPFNEARRFARDSGLKSEKEWCKHVKGKSIVFKIPYAPQFTYKKEWNGWGDWLGTGNKKGTYFFHIKKDFLPFNEARMFVRDLNLKGLKDWHKYIRCKTNILKIPHYPNKIYKKEWAGWNDWFGTNNVCGRLRKYEVNDNFFSKWSHDMAYVFGLWFADGYINKKRNTFSITLYKNDSYLLKEILLVMESNYTLRVYKNSNCLYFNIISPTIIKDIIRLGGKERKSLDCRMPHVPKKYLPDFVRGYFDGDGCIYYSKTSKKYLASTCSGSKFFSIKLLKNLRKNIPNFKGNLYKDVRNRKYRPNFKSKKKIFTTYNLCFSVNDTKRLRDFMYQNNPKLKMLRKYNLFMLVDKDIVIATQDRIYLSYKKAKKYVKKLNLINREDWQKYCKSGNKPKNIPTNPYKVYKNKGWISQKDWLGH